ncbi:MAG: metallophosphoesterase [Victivallaceae bacterium]|nr:metallophosphoesterase [Victivallaceae bacterium]
MKLTELGMMLMAVLLCGCTAAPELRVGILGDVQGYAKDGDPGMRNLETAFNMLRDRNADVIMMTGDLSDNGDPAVYKQYRELYDRIFADRMPIQVAVMGNHDYWNDLPVETSRRNFSEAIDQSSPDIQMIVNDYSFIALSPEDGNCNGTYTEKSAEFLAANLSYAETATPDNPIFLLTHQHPADTVYGSAGWSNKFISDHLADHPRVIAFSGHSHYPLEDERSIAQNRFTAVGASSLNYCEMEPGKVNGSVPPHAADCVQFLYMEVFKDHADIHRYDVKTGREIKPDAVWRIELPHNPARSAYTERRANDRTAPEFPAGAAGSVSKNGNGRLILSFDAARHDDFVHSYDVAIYEKLDDGKFHKLNDIAFFSDFYRGLERMSEHPEFQLPDQLFVAGSEYILKIIPVESFGKRGDTPLTVRFTAE